MAGREVESQMERENTQKTSGQAGRWTDGRTNGQAGGGHKAPHKPDVTVHRYNPRIWEQQFLKFKAILRYLVPYQPGILETLPQKKKIKK